jgi:hypothetical protein
MIGQYLPNKTKVVLFIGLKFSSMARWQPMHQFSIFAFQICFSPFHRFSLSCLSSTAMTSNPQQSPGSTEATNRAGA